MLDGSDVGLEIISSLNLASEPLGEAPPDGAFAQAWSVTSCRAGVPKLRSLMTLFDIKVTSY